MFTPTISNPTNNNINSYVIKFSTVYALKINYNNMYLLSLLIIPSIGSQKSEKRVLPAAVSAFEPTPQAST